MDSVYGPLGGLLGFAKDGGWWYRVAADFTTHESSLQKLNPGEYTEDTQDIHAPITEGAQ